MKDIKFIKEPGYIYDLFFLFILNFNIDYCLTNFINYNKPNEDTEYFNKILLDFDAIPDDLLPFFYIKEDCTCFMTQYYFEPYSDVFATAYNLNTVQTAISDYEQVAENVLKFYFMDIDGKALVECKKSIIAVGKLIKESKYNDTVKSSLYAFFIDPRPIIQKLSYELMSKEFQLSKQYEKNYKKIIELQHQVDIELISDKLKMDKNQKSDIEPFNEVYISFCFINKNCLKAHFFDKKTMLSLGVDYLSCLEYIISKNQPPEIDIIGNALSEKNRIDILDLMLRKDEITIKDIEQELSFTGTNAYYHLSLMIKANMIKTRNQGRTVLYSINKQCFDVICDILSKYSTKIEGGYDL